MRMAQRQEQQGAGGDALGMAGGGMGQVAQGMTAQQVAQFKQAFQAAQNLLYDKRVFGQLMKGVESADPAAVLSGTLLKIVETVERKVGGLDLAVLMALTIATLQDIAGAVIETGRAQLDAEQVQKALAQAVRMWLETNAERVPPQQMAEIGQMIGGGAQVAPAGPPDALMASGGAR